MDQKILITGSSTGFGRLTAESLLKNGHTVVASMRGVEGKNAQAAAELREAGAHVVELDVTDDASVERGVAAAIEAAGGLDVVVNNAGANFGYAELMDSELVDFDKNFAINTKGVVHGIKFGVPRMNDGGRIVNVSSMAGLQGAFNLSPYVASKWAVIGITRTASMELGSRGIRVNAICPTSVNTPMANTPEGQPQLNMERKAVPLGRIAEPEEVAAMIHFLDSTDCNFVNGQAIAVDGGFSAGMSPVAYETLANA